MSGTPSRFTRLVIAAFLVVPAFVLSVSVTSAATPTKEQVDAAKQRLAELQAQFEASVERWNNAKYELEQAQARLADAKAMKDAADKDAATARAALAQRAVDAYTGMGSDLDVLLGAQSFSEFSDRLEFMGAIAQSDTDLAAQKTFARFLDLAHEMEVPVIPVYDTGPDAAVLMAENAAVFGCERVLIGTSRRGALYHLVKGHFQQRLEDLLPPDVAVEVIAPDSPRTPPDHAESGAPAEDHVPVST